MAWDNCVDDRCIPCEETLCMECIRRAKALCEEDHHKCEGEEKDEEA